MKSKFLAIVALTLSSCSTVKVPAEPDKEVPSAPVVVEQPEAPVVVAAPPAAPAASVSLNSITLAARDSQCAKVSWAGRGRAPLGYVKGMAFAFAKSYCAKRFDGISDSSKNALTSYGVAVTPVNTYALLIGLGLRESSGNYCEGRDMSASNTSSDTAEAGPFQTSWNAAGAHSSLPKIALEYKNGARCFLDVWQEGVSAAHCRAQGSYYGSGNGLEFQKLARNCPQFAAEFAAVTILTLKNHYGPLIRKEAQFKQECVDMFSSVKKLVDQNPSLCKAL
jgi:hypothetical protein